jgi:nucleotide-binding universal stress UspA family protein
MFATIMVPLDGSAFAEQGLPLAVSIAQRADAQLHLVAVRAKLPLDADRTAEEEYLVGIGAQLESLRPGRISTRVLTNEARALEYPPPSSAAIAETLVEHAAAEGVGLIVLTTHGRGGLMRAWLGSVADRLIRGSRSPVLAVRPVDEAFGLAASADRGFGHILIPLDGSRAAEQAIPVAQAAGKLFGAHYTMLRVVSPLTWEPGTSPYGAPSWTSAPPMSTDAAVAYLDSVAEPMREEQVAVTTTVVYGTSVAAAIVEHGEEHAADLIVLTTSGAGGVRRLLLGSVADKVVRSGSIPVLVCNVRQLEEGASSEAGGEHVAPA